MKVIIVPLIFFIAILFSLNSCESSSKCVVEDLNFPLIIDDLTERDMDSTKVGSINGIQHLLYYIGKEQDTLTVNRRIRPLYYIPPFNGEGDYETWFKDGGPGVFGEYFLYTSEKTNLDGIKLSDTLNLLIKVDTTQLINNRGFKSYPVLISNKSESSVVIGYCRDIQLLTEAKDPNGVWRPIEKRYRSECCVAGEYIILPNNEIALTSEVIYVGEFNTLLRLKIKNSYSNEFEGSINLSQFH
jgi:hypothetical protein